MAITHKLTKRIGDKDNAALWQHARDTQNIFDKIPVIQHRTIDALYAEPMTMGSLAEEPFSIELVRVVNLFSPPTPVTCGGMVHFTWLPERNGAAIASIDGMSVPVDGKTKFRFYYRVTYKMES